MTADWDLVRSERQALVDLFAAVDGEQSQRASLCEGWTVHDVLAHLASALDASTALSLRLAVLSLGRPKVLIDKLAEAYAPRSHDELLGIYRRHVADRFAPPGMGWKAPLTDVMVHRMDVAVPLGIDPGRPAESWRPVLEFLTSGLPMMGSFRGRRPQVAWSATDLGWSAGSGPPVSGPADAVGLTLAGRPALLHRLSGEGVPVLQTWMGH